MGLLKLLLARVLYGCKALFEDPVELFQALGVQSGDQVLEIGCAIGYHTFALARLASPGRVCAVDIWEEAIACLRSRIRPGQNIEAICRRAEAVELPAGSLDKVVCLDTLHDLPGPELAVQRWAGFLKEGGKLYYRDPLIPWERIAAFSEGRLRHTGEIQGIQVFAAWSEQERRDWQSVGGDR
jgi:ubiquinone/menaquinone biosynthesis C-methylase UbiE